ncbi:CMP-N-acetylneuraminate-beta-1,4-galactoside alpha-2,3-sialyltransferase isoform X1 [Perognathus longimembris pacificus]|uniref:CMP-N-acetylneuraminate-beta-1,4-galactoside alpha-2,3-sialyltransferase isoform X1 n=1 Tax=Perognathus longimembris pacificus TaxID=214514 RepID=UPI002019CAB7|nr:CMP-N-acetylneuraminate-beta-1,4-galactoside alpha-2,3-sialyltransferase isoform X1 [Perognathus longimembris pacificus]
MGLLVFVRNLLLALCLFLVLGFLYYSAWKLHLLQWEDSNSVVLSFDSAGQTLGSEYDRLGFLLKLDSKLPAELATKYANFSEGACKPGYASALMTAIFPRFSKPAPMFLDDSFRKWARIREFVPPFGIKGQDNLIKAILSVTKEYRLTPALDSLRCRRCIIVGNGGVLANKSLGSRIDDYDIVVRLNSAPVKGFEKDVGSKTTLRITYPEGAMQRPEQYERDSLFVLAGFKWQDFKWLKYIVYKERVSASDGFWKSVATRVPKEPPEIRILNPYFIQEAAFTLIGLPFNNGLMGRGNIPTLGSVAVTMALHGCDEVAVAGFGYDMSTPNAPLHYYETVRMAAIKEVRAWAWGHSSAEPRLGVGSFRYRGQALTACGHRNGNGMSQQLLWLPRTPRPCLPLAEQSLEVHPACRTLTNEVLHSSLPTSL